MEKANNYLILFADLIGSTEVASEAIPSFYAQNYIASYHWAARRAEEFIKKTIFSHDKFKKTIEKIEVVGDEVASFSLMDEFTDSNIEEQEDLVASAVAFAYVIKLYWLASPYNLSRMLDKQFPREIAVGIHIGPAALVPTPEDDKSPRIASFHINVTKKIENQAREGGESLIFVSYEVADMFQGWLKRRKQLPFKCRSPLTFAEFAKRPEGDSVKGVSKRLMLLELACAKNKTDGLINYLKKLFITPKKFDIEAEDAAWFWAKNYFPFTRNPFRYDKDTRAIDHISFKSDTAADYISQWFEAVGAPNRLFFNEYWFIYNCYIISCAMLRHPSVQPKEQAKYVGIAKKIFNLLKEMVNIVPEKR